MNKMYAQLYIRVSSLDQTKNFSLESQEEICRKVAQDRGYEVDKVFREAGVSAKTANRPELIKLLEYCRLHKNKIASVMVYKYDRLARNTLDFLAVKAKLAENGIKLESATEQVDDSPSGKFVETLLAGIAQMNNEVSAERIRAGVQKRFFAGLTSKPPLGYKMQLVDGKKTPVPDDNFEALQKAWLLMAVGSKSLSEITRIMNDQGLRVRWGNLHKKITIQAASKIFKNTFYFGFLTSKKHPDWIAKGVHRPMITEDTYNQVRAVILGKTRNSFAVKRRVYNPQFPLRGLVKCSVCRGNMVAGNVRGRSKIYPKYWCPDGCVSTISSDELHELLGRDLGGLACSEELIDLFIFRLKVLYDKRKGKLLEQKKLAGKEIEETKRMMSLLIEGHLKGLYPDDIYKEQKAKMEDMLLASQIVVSDSTMDKYDLQAITGFIKALMYDLAKAYEVSDYSQKRVLIGSIYPSGLLFNGKSLLNQKLNEISPAFRLIHDLCEPVIPLGADERS